MNVNQTYVDQIAAVVLFKTHRFASVYQNTKEIHPALHVNHHKTLAQSHLVDQTHNVPDSATELPNVHVYQASLKVRIQSEDVSNQRALVNHSHAVLGHLVMLLGTPFVIAQNQQLEIHSENVLVQLYRKSFAIQAHVEVNIIIHSNFLKMIKYFNR